MRLNKFVSHKLLVAVSAFGMVATPAWAGFAQGNQVTLGGQPAFAIAGSAEGFSPDHRAWLAQDALDNALVLANNKSASAVTVARENDACVVLLDGRRVATADANSARLEGMTVHQLADKWADGIRNFLADSNRTMSYVAELTGKNPINANVAILERRLFAPPGTVLPVAFTTPISSELLASGQIVEGTLTQDVVIGNYMLPVSSAVVGTVNQISTDGYTVAFNTLKTPNGTIVPIDAVLTGPIGSIETPHLVATLSMPYGDYPRYQGYAETGCRVPAQIGIGVLGGGSERLVLRKGANVSWAAGTPMAVVLETPQQVAVVVRQHHM